MDWGLLQSPDFRQKVKNAKVLCVGAGGIGCELLKTLVCSGFEDITVVDLDTIETSNLNRQFLFRKHHVKQSKARTAASVIRTIKPDAKIDGIHSNVKESRFDVEFYASFDIILNGLDNMEARRHVNRLCMAAKVPLIESGTQGHLGQVTVHLKGVSACYDCSPKPVPKTFPICTLRNTPDKPVHCIVWSKELLFARLFGRADVVSDLDETSKVGTVATAATDDGAAANGPTADADDDGAAVAAAEAEERERQLEEASFFLFKEGESGLQFASRVFQRVFCSDIERVVQMEELWKTRTPPKPLSLLELVPDLATALSAALSAVPPTDRDSSCSLSACKVLGLTNPNEMWDTRDNARVFLTSVALYCEQRREEVGSAVFDKDDTLAVEFVTSASNLRSACYGIPTQALFDAKGMAGNIIHAIATTNAMVSGLIVVEAMKVLAGMLDSPRWTFLFENASSKRLTSCTMPDKPSKGCLACGVANLSLHVNTKTMTLQELVDQVLKKRLSMSTPTLMCGNFMYEEGEGMEEDEVEANAALLPKPLAELPGGGLIHGSIVRLSDDTLRLTKDLIISHQEVFDLEKAPEGFILHVDDGAAAHAEEAAEDNLAAGAPADAADESDDIVCEDDGNGDDGSDGDICIMEAMEATAAGEEEEGGKATAAKRKRGADACNDDTDVLVDDADDGPGHKKAAL